MLSDEKEPQKLTGKFVYSTQQLFLFYLYSKKKRLYTSEAGSVASSSVGASIIQRLFILQGVMIFIQHILETDAV